MRFHNLFQVFPSLPSSLIVPLKIPLSHLLISHLQVLGHVWSSMNLHISPDLQDALKSDETSMSYMKIMKTSSKILSIFCFHFFLKVFFLENSETITPEGTLRTPTYFK